MRLVLDKPLILERHTELNHFFFQLLVTTEDGLRLVPEIYSVPGDKVEAEYKKPGSQQREVVGKLPFKWAQSLYVVGRLLQDVRTLHLVHLYPT